jgi:hypothetical protein
MQRWYIDQRGQQIRTPYDVPVDDDNRRTEHHRYTCQRRKCDHAEWLTAGTARFCPEHGQRLLAQQPSSPVRVIASDTRRMYGRGAVPWIVLAAAPIVDWGAQVAGVPAATIAAIAPAAAGATYIATRQVLTARAIRNRRIESGQRDGRRVRRIKRRAALAGMTAAEGCLWAAGLVGTELSTPVGKAVAIAGVIRWAIVAKPHWDATEARRVRALMKPVLDVMPVAAVPEVDPFVAQVTERWNTRIGQPNGPLAGTILVDVKPLPGAGGKTRLPNWSARVVAHLPGSINMRESRPALLGRIAAAYRCTYADVNFFADEADLGTGWLRVQPDNPLATVDMWTGAQSSDWSKGISRIGRFDDAAPILYQWWTKTGAAHDLLSGCTGSGKSELIAQLILTSLHSNGLVLDWVGDPQGGQSYGALQDHVDWFAGNKTEITYMLLAALKEMLRRNDVLSAARMKTWRPTRDMPLLVLTLDEAQSYLDDLDIVTMVERLVGMGRKCGIKVRLSTQIAAAYNLGGSTYIKEQAKAGQTVVMRAMTEIAARSAVEGDCPIDPTALPERWGPNTSAPGDTTAGLLYLQGLHGRDVYGRADYTGEDMTRWLLDADGRPTISPGAFSEAAQATSGPLWRDRHQRRRLALEAGRSDADLLPKGKALELIQAADTASPKPAPAQEAPKVAKDLVLEAARKAANADGVVRREQIVHTVAGKIADGTRDKALTDLVASGALTRVRNGVYEVPGTR